MTLRINHNIAAANAHRNLVRNDAKLGKTLEHLSSGNRIVRAADSPAALVISEQMRAQVAGLSQAIMNSEGAVALAQTAEASLNEVNSLLISMRQLAVHAANEAVNDVHMLEADQAELLNSLDSIDRISKSTQFGTKQLLDGTNGISGMATGEFLEFVEADPKTKPSPQSGYAVSISQEATQAQLSSKTVLTQDMIDSGETLSFEEGGRNLQLTTKLGESYEQLQNRVNDEFRQAGLKLDAYFDQGKLNVLHQNYGSEQHFSVASSTAGVLSDRAETPTWIENGQDVQGTIGQESAVGKGQTLMGSQGTNVAGLEVRFTGVANAEQPEVGRVTVANNALTFQVGGNRNQTVSVDIPDTNTRKLALDVNNESGFNSLRELDLRNMQGAQDALMMIDQAIDDVTTTRAGLGAVQKNTLETNLSSLRVAKESLMNAESVIRDVDMAEEMSEYTKNQILTQSATAMLAQANQTPNNVLTLLK